MTQREIKFRAIKYHTNETVFFTLEDLMRGKVVFAYPEHWQFSQYTGLKDKNGKEIWEGDIILCTACPHTHNCQVVFKEGAFRFVDDHENFFESYQDYREIIGNVYSNPELLK